MDNRDTTKKWVEHWDRVGPILEKVRHDELRAMTEEESAEACVTLFEFALASPSYKARTTSGLVEQQRLFMKLASRKK